MEQNVIKQKLTSPKGKQKKISAEASLADDMPKGKGSKTNPSNKSLDGEDFLADTPKGNKTVKKATGKASSNKKLDAEDYLSDAPKFKKSVKKGNKKLKPEGDLAKMPKYGKGHNNTSKAMDGEEYLSDAKHMKSFNKFINENYINELHIEPENSTGQPIVDDRAGIENRTYLEISDGRLKLTDNKENAHAFLDDSDAQQFAEDHCIFTYQLEMDNSGENFTIIALNSLEGVDTVTRGMDEEPMKSDKPNFEFPDEWKNKPDLKHIRRPFDLDTQG